jgi:hypothetical protein
LVAGHLAALNEKSILTRSFGRESFFCKNGHLQQNLVVFASNWRSGNLAFAFIEEVGEWNPLVFAFNSVKRETSHLFLSKKWIREPSFCIYRISWRIDSTSFCVIFEDMSN